MKNLIILILSIIFATACATTASVQDDGRNLSKGIWISDEGGVLIIEGNHKNKFYREPFKENNLQVLVENSQIKVVEVGDTLYNNIPAGDTMYYNFEITSVSTSKMEIKSLDEASKKLIKGKKSLTFTRKEHYENKAFKLEKLVFKSSMCFGTCPILDLTIYPNRDIELDATYFAEMGKKDEKKSGLYKGTLDQELYDKIIKELKQSQAGLHDYKPSRECCDGATKTIITYHNGKVNEVRTMFAPSIFQYLIKLLYTAAESESLQKVED